MSRLAADADALAASLPPAGPDAATCPLRLELAALPDDVLERLAATTSADAHRTNVAGGAWRVLEARYVPAPWPWPADVD